MAHAALFWWILVPTLLGGALYASAAMCVWPRARPLLPLWLLLPAILLPPLFPLLLFYLLFLFWATPRPVVVVGASPVSVVTARFGGRGV